MAVRRFERTDLVPRLKSQSFDARASIAAARRENLMSRSVVSDAISVYSWRESAYAAAAPGAGTASQGGRSLPPRSPVGRVGGGRGKFSASQSISMVSDGTGAQRRGNVPKLRALKSR